MALIIAIDGPAASGKGTLARKLAERYQLKHLDTGLLYRATAAALLANNTPLDDENKAEQAAYALDVSALDRVFLSQHHIGEAASKIAALQRVRNALFDVQRSFATSKSGAVLDGRDIATVICPDAAVKLYITANAEERAKRRHKEALAKGDNTDFSTILADIRRRDERDQNRTNAPLQTAPDAHLIDTSKMDIETAFQSACAFADPIMLFAKQAISSK